MSNYENFALGIDISHHQNNVLDGLNFRAENIDFVFCKASQGTGFHDPLFSHNWQLLKDRNIIRGAYHFYDTNVRRPIDQANFFYQIVVNTASGYNSEDIPLALDFEISRDYPPYEGMAEDLLLFLNRIKELTGRTPIIYVNPNDARQYLNNSFSEFTLWEANWKFDWRNLSPDPIPIWGPNEWKFWQYSDGRGLPFINGHQVDRDIFNGNLDQLRQFIADH